jgi:alkyldihydroxyacetonephosphate synthase
VSGQARARSFWGWGYEDRFPDEDGRKGMGQAISSMLGFEGLELLTPPRLDAIELRPSRLAPPASLAPFMRAEPHERIHHTYGKGYRDIARGFRGDFSPAPDWVARPRNEDDVRAVLDWATDARVAVVPFGGGTSVVGGVEADVGDAYGSAVSLDLAALDAVLEVERTSLHARIQAGALGPHLESQLAAHGLTLRHFPQSFEFSSLGGWIATRAGGHFATVYTHIDDLVASVRMVSPAGVMESRRLPGSGAGPSPDRLVLGSEGILGVITEAWMRVRPRPLHRSTATVHFDRWESAVQAVRALSQSGLYPSNCRLLDAREAALNFVTGDGSHVLIVGFESPDHPMVAWMDRALVLCADHGGRCPAGPVHKEGDERSGNDTGGAGHWKQAFVEAPYLMNTLVSLGVIVDTFETSVPWDRFDALHAAVMQRMGDAMRRVCGAGSITCRFTHVYPDGPAPYYTFLAPGRRGAELEQWTELKRVASDALIEHGATITHHHAVGRLHKPWYERQRPKPFAEALRAAKASLDPAGVLNPGVLV